MMVGQRVKDEGRLYSCNHLRAMVSLRSGRAVISFNFSSNQFDQTH